MLEGVDGSLIAGVLGYAINTASDLDPEVAAVFDREATPREMARLRELEHSCIPDTIARWAFQRTTDLLAEGRTLRQVIDQEPAVRDYLAGQALGARPISAPMLVLSGEHDDLIPHAQARAMATGYCRLGGTVDFRTDGIPELIPKTALNHATPVLTHIVAALGWLGQRFAGQPAPSNCQALLEGTPAAPLGSSGGLSR